MVLLASADDVENVYYLHFQFAAILEYYKSSSVALISKEEWIWRVLTSSRFSKYSKRMSQSFRENSCNYIRQCIEKNAPIHIVLAGFPGKCANPKKVLHRTPDIGELAALAQCDLLNRIIQLRHPPGIKVTFFSDYICLRYSFFPNSEDIALYAHILDEWITKTNLPVEIVPANKIFPETQLLENAFLDSISSKKTFSQYACACPDDQKLIFSMNDNMCMAAAKDFYAQKLGFVPSDKEIAKASVRYYTDFWKRWSACNTVQRYFGDVIYGSPVAYHPEKRLCLRLQPSAARVAPWNGCGIVADNRVFSIDERICVQKGLTPLFAKSGYFWGYSENSLTLGT